MGQMGCQPSTTPPPSSLLRLTLPRRSNSTHFTDEEAEAQTAIKLLAHSFRTTVHRARILIYTPVPEIAGSVLSS